MGIVLVLVIGLGLASREYDRSLPGFVVENCGDALWTVAMFLTLAVLFPGWTPLRLGLIAFGISVAVELSQLIDLAWLNAIRKTPPGRLFLGSGFLWVDLVRYLVGAIVATTVDWLWNGCPKQAPTLNTAVNQ
jgi:hypothetical protein